MVRGDLVYLHPPVSAHTLIGTLAIPIINLFFMFPLSLKAGVPPSPVFCFLAQDAPAGLPFAPCCGLQFTRTVGAGGFRSTVEGTHAPPPPPTLEDPQLAECMDP